MSGGGTTSEQMVARIAELDTRIAKGGALRFKVSEKGAVSVYGLGRFPVTLYLEQWENSFRIPTNCVSSSKLTELNSRSRITSRILKAFGGVERQWRLFQVVL